MKTTIPFALLTSFLALLSINPASAGQADGKAGWKAGVARAVITPDEPIWLAGYASRDRPSEGTLVDLWAKALALQDSQGHKIVTVTTDLLGFPRQMSNRIRDQLAVHYGLTRSQIILSSSHTHSGPVLQDALSDIYPLEQQHKDAIAKYSADLEKKIVSLAGEAIRSMVPARLYSQNGVTRFQVNRRNNAEAALNSQTHLNGPNDYAVPVLKVADEPGRVMALLFGYACHATVLETYQISGDYPGYAQLELERLYPGTTAMFFQGAGADQNPIPRRTIPLARQYGRELAGAVDRVLNEEMRELDPAISTAYSEIPLRFQTPLSKEELLKIEKESTGSTRRWASSQLAMLNSEGSLLTSYPYPVQIVKLGDQAIMALGGELVVQYAIELKTMFGPEIFVMGYANDETAYIPSETVLEEGGYEGESSQKVYGMPAKWETDIQKKILAELEKLGVRVGLKPLPTDPPGH